MMSEGICRFKLLVLSFELLWFVANLSINYY